MAEGLGAGGAEDVARGALIVLARIRRLVPRRDEWLAPARPYEGRAYEGVRARGSEQPIPDGGANKGLLAPVHERRNGFARVRPARLALLWRVAAIRKLRLVGRRRHRLVGVDKDLCRRRRARVSLAGPPARRPLKLASRAGRQAVNRRHALSVNQPWRRWRTRRWRALWLLVRLERRLWSHLCRRPCLWAVVDEVLRRKLKLAQHDGALVELERDDGNVRGGVLALVGERARHQDLTVGGRETDGRVRPISM